MVKLRQREIPAVVFRRELPEHLADGPCFIEINARAGGAINPEYLAGVEALSMRAAILDRRLERIEDDETFVKTQRENAKEVGALRFKALYDACVIDWDSNILDDGKPIECSRGNFLELTKTRGIPEITSALMDLEAECLAAGRAISEADEEAEKN